MAAELGGRQMPAPVSNSVTASAPASIWAERKRTVAEPPAPRRRPGDRGSFMSLSGRQGGHQLDEPDEIEDPSEICAARAAISRRAMIDLAQQPPTLSTDRS
jgi:hypothetical protein